MRLRSILAGVLVAMMLSGAGFGPVCQAACTEAAQALSCGGHSHGMQPAGMHSGSMQSSDAGSTKMAGMPNCAVCGSRGSIATTPAAPCGHDSIAQVRALDGHEDGAALHISQCQAGTTSALAARRTVARSSLAEPPGLPMASPISLHTTLRV